MFTGHERPIAADDFSACIAPLGPFEPQPVLAAGVSGGADSMALALLANDWARARGGSLLALIVDHGLRPESAAEASAAASRLGERGIATRILPVAGLARGPALAERARAARLAALTGACAASGILHLLLAHHAADQAETLLIRSLGGSGPAGLAAMSPLVETAFVRILRPLLAIPPVRLRTYLQAVGMAWVEDPSNADRRALRSRLRQLRADRDGRGSATEVLVSAARVSGGRRSRQEAAAADVLAGQVSLWPEGFALLSAGPVAPAVLAALVQTLSGAPFPPATTAIAALAASPRPATLAGVRILPAGRWGDGWLLTREVAAMAGETPAHPGAIWDGRFRLTAAARPPEAATIGALGGDAAGLRRVSRLPAAVLQTLPALRKGETLLAVPHLGYPDVEACRRIAIAFAPARAAAAAPILAA